MAVTPKVAGHKVLCRGTRRRKPFERGCQYLVESYKKGSCIAYLATRLQCKESQVGTYYLTRPYRVRQDLAVDPLQLWIITPVSRVCGVVHMSGKFDTRDMLHMEQGLVAIREI